MTKELKQYSTEQLMRELLTRAKDANNPKDEKITDFYLGLFYGFDTDDSGVFQYALKIIDLNDVNTKE